MRNRMYLSGRVSAHEGFCPCEFILPNSAGVKFGDFGKKVLLFQLAAMM